MKMPSRGMQVWLDVYVVGVLLYCILTHNTAWSVVMAVLVGISYVLADVSKYLEERMTK